MTSERRIKVLEALLEELAMKEVRLRSHVDFKRDIGNFSKKTGIPELEIREVVEPLIRRLTDKMLAH